MRTKCTCTSTGGAVRVNGVQVRVQELQEGSATLKKINARYSFSYFYSSLVGYTHTLKHSQTDILNYRCFINT